MRGGQIGEGLGLPLPKKNTESPHPDEEHLNTTHDSIPQLSLSNKGGRFW